mmetsp:Transcript_17228/g.32610  ORF Transcript_17228/g.32610 Transcript_17228/m.32610 type:complete len:165 (-) Transcript_17228:14-508(-)
MRNSASNAQSVLKDTAKSLFKLPQAVGRTILSVPEAATRKIIDRRGNRCNTENDQHSATIDFISKEIIGNQERNELVRKSQSECMKEITDHLFQYLHENPDATYEEWIASLHPDNAAYTDGRIDHRFYVEESDHRLLWNECMSTMQSEERIVSPKSLEPNYNHK